MDNRGLANGKMEVQFDIDSRLTKLAVANKHTRIPYQMCRSIVQESILTTMCLQSISDERDTAVATMYFSQVIKHEQEQSRGLAFLGTLSQLR